MNKPDIVQQMTENNQYLQALARRIRTAGLERIAEEMEAIALQNQECLEVLVESLN